MYTGTAKVLVPYGWTILHFQVLASCYPHAHIVDLGTTTASIQMMWPFPAVMVSMSNLCTSHCSIILSVRLMIGQNVDIP
jgi:hypothetical protein